MTLQPEAEKAQGQVISICKYLSGSIGEGNKEVTLLKR